MHLGFTRHHTQDVPDSGQCLWVCAWPAGLDILSRNPLFTSFFILHSIFSIASGLVRKAGLRLTSSLNWSHVLWLRCFKAFGVFSTAVSIVVEGARFNQENQGSAFLPTFGWAAYSKQAAR